MVIETGRDLKLLSAEGGDPDGGWIPRFFTTGISGGGLRERKE